MGDLGTRPRLSASISDVERMADSVFIDGPVLGRAPSRFWVLLLLAAVIASAGLVADSTATVIGAMIVAPLMTPILGVALSIVLADRAHLMRSAALIVGGAALVVAIGIVMALVVTPADAFADNGQVNARISPRLVDLIAALATGLVGAFALVRSDVSDTLPGVAIAISLVPPLACVGLLLGVGRVDDSLQALLLFSTNVAAIIATGVLVLLVYRVRAAALASGHAQGELRPRTVAVVGLGILIVAIPLAFGSIRVSQDEQLAADAQPIVEAWASGAGWEVAGVDAVNGRVVVTAFGPPPQLAVEKLRNDLDAAGLRDHDLIVRLVVGGSRYCPAGQQACTLTPG
jgi:uncharacterized hydrophobic protein (TIGR00271 family)